MSRTFRRTVLRSIAAGAVAVPLVSGSSAAQRAPAFVRPGVNRIDFDGDGEADLNVVAARDPATDRGRVAHATSGGETSPDYVTTVRPLNVTLGSIADGATLTYEYYEGADHTHAAPDEVWLYIRDAGGDYHTVWHTSNDDKVTSIPDEQWERRDVHQEILGDPDPEDNPGHKWFELVETGRDPIDDHRGDNNVANLVEVFGEDAVLLRLGAGVGATAGGVSDVYVRDLRYDDRSRGNFPTNGGGSRGHGR